MKNRNNPNSKGKIIIDPNARKLTHDELCRCITGMSIDAFVRAVRENKDGKYDRLYCKK
jgi:hypothetical protein